ncbi:hypothetical protein ACQPYE_26095 [Actinosynnema sp. CA-299493]
MSSKKSMAMAAVVIAFTATAVPASAGTAALTPQYSALLEEPEDLNFQYRAMPALHRVTWTEGGQTRQRFIRSYQVSGDNGSLLTQIQYHVGDGASLVDTANWRQAKVAGSDRELRETTGSAKVNNVFRETGGATVVLDERVTDLGFTRRESADGGVTWQSTPATVDMAGGAVVSPNARAFQGVIRLPGDGALVMPFYAAHQKVEGTENVYRWASHLLVSEKPPAGSTAQEGAQWKRVATPFKSDRNSYTEATVTRLADGRLFMIARYDYTSGGLRYAKLASRTTDLPVATAADLRGTTWGAWTDVVVPGAADYPNPVQGVGPVLHTMDQGVLMLNFGRPRNKITFSHDGGKTWATSFNAYDNLPTDGCPSEYHMPCSSFGSSGYMGVAVTSPTSAYVMGDNCHTNWGCDEWEGVDGPTRYSYPRGTESKLWIRIVTLA